MKDVVGRAKNISTGQIESNFCKKYGEREKGRVGQCGVGGDGRKGAGEKKKKKTQEGRE